MGTIPLLLDLGAIELINWSLIHKIGMIVCDWAEVRERGRIKEYLT